MPPRGKFYQYRHWIVAGIVLVFLLLIGFEIFRTYRENSHDAAILAAAQKYGVDPTLIKAVVWRESRFNPRARGAAREIGLMQIQEAAAGEWARAEGLPYFSHEHLYDPAKNLLAGTWYLRKLMRRYPRADDPVVFALADYNAGRTHVLRWNKGAAATNSAQFLKQMDYPGTRAYIAAIQKRHEYYRKTWKLANATQTR
ncbi:MAG TPA: lytic transglycosylase domain-containing protein [Verrucomicrobiae bacterium]|nr:lytic transglycosylase domain-containing protein [Verrucomicrobiae bacterium]